MNSFVSGKKLVVCCGSGGVGKTTLSAALGVWAARQGQNALVLTIDPAKRLATSLGIDAGSSGPKKVPNQNFSGTLWASLLDSEKVFRDFVKEHSTDAEAAERILGNRLFKMLSTTFSGSQEFTALELLLSLVESGDFDIIILDTPPADNAIDFLNSPEKLRGLFRESVTKWFSSGKTGDSFVSKIIRTGTRAAFKALERLTGAQFLRELTEFFSSIKGVQEMVSQRSLKVHDLLVSQETSFLLVTGFDETKLVEAESFRRDLSKSGYKMGGVVVNRAFPQWFSADTASLGHPTEGEKDDLVEASRIFESLQKYHQGREEAYSSFLERMDKDLTAIRLPDMNKDIYGLEAIGLLSEELAKRWEHETRTGK